MAADGSDARGWPGDDVEVPPHGLDLDAIIQIGRRQVRHRRVAMVGGTAAVLAAVAAIPATMSLRPSDGGGDAGQSPAPTAPLPVLDCDITALPLPQEYAEPGPDTFPYVELMATDPTGRYAIGNAYLRTFIEGGHGTRSDPDGVVLWDDGRPTVPSPLRGNTQAQDVNADGVVVGLGEEMPASERARGYAWIYRDGRLTQLPTPDGYDSAEATAINAAGDVVGTVIADDDRQTVVVWPADDPDNPRVMAAPTGRDVVAGGINDDGLVVGEYHTRSQSGADSDSGVYLWEPDDGTLVELPVPEGTYDVYGAAVRGNWAIGQAAVVPDGPGAPRTGTSVSLLWDLRTHTLEVVAKLGEVPSQVHDVNAAGDTLFAMPPGVIRGGAAYTLPDPVEEGAVTPPDTAYTPMVAVVSISDDGSTITGKVYFDATPEPITSLPYPVMWRC